MSVPRLFFLNDEKLILNWDKWGKDFYVYDSGGNQWVSDLDQSVRRKQIETDTGAGKGRS